jgi:hypothetical protein
LATLRRRRELGEELPDFFFSQKGVKIHILLPQNYKMAQIVQNGRK